MATSTPRPLQMPFSGVGPAPGAPTSPDTILEVAPPPPSSFEPLDWDDRNLHLYDVVDDRYWNLGNATSWGAFSPDGSWFAYREGARSVADGALHVLNLDNGDVVNLGDASNEGVYYWETEERLVYADSETDVQQWVDITTGEREPTGLPRSVVPGERARSGQEQTDWLSLVEPLNGSGNLWRRLWRVEYLDGSRPAVAFEAHAAALGPDDTIVFAVSSASEPQSNDDMVQLGDIYIADPFTMEATLIATVEMDYWNWPLDVSENHVVWTRDFCSRDPKPEVYDRDSGTITRFALATSVDQFLDMWAVFTPSGGIAFGSFGAKRIFDPVSAEYEAVLPFDTRDVGWSSDYRYAVTSQQFGHGGYCL